jgi:hypothetical protein
VLMEQYAEPQLAAAGREIRAPAESRVAETILE